MDNNRNSILAVALIAVLMSATLIGAVALVNSGSGTQVSNYTGSDSTKAEVAEAAVTDTSSSARLCEKLQSILTFSEEEYVDEQIQVVEAYEAQSFEVREYGNRVERSYALDISDVHCATESKLADVQLYLNDYP